MSNTESHYILKLLTHNNKTYYYSGHTMNSGISDPKYSILVTEFLYNTKNFKNVSLLMSFLDNKYSDLLGYDNNTNNTRSNIFEIRDEFGGKSLYFSKLEVDIKLEIIKVNTTKEFIENSEIDLFLKKQALNKLSKQEIELLNLTSDVAEIKLHS